MKVNVIKIEGTKINTVATLSVPSRELDGTCKIFDWISRFDREQASEIFGVPIQTLNVAEYTEGDGFITTYRVFKGRSKDTFYRNSFQIDGRVNPETKITQKNPVILADGTEADFCAGFDFYPEGYILSTGKDAIDTKDNLYRIVEEIERSASSEGRFSPFLRRKERIQLFVRTG